MAGAPELRGGRLLGAVLAVAVLRRERDPLGHLHGDGDLPQRPLAVIGEPAPHAERRPSVDELATVLFQTVERQPVLVLRTLRREDATAARGQQPRIPLPGPVRHRHAQEQPSAQHRSRHRTYPTEPDPSDHVFPSERGPGRAGQAPRTRRRARVHGLTCEDKSGGSRVVPGTEGLAGSVPRAPGQVGRGAFLVIVRVERVSDFSDVLVVEAVSTTRPGRCPDCRKQARRTHSSYQRDLDERPLGSYWVIVRLRVRRYFCDRKSCSRKTFVEQVPGLSERHRRSSTGLTGWLRSIAIELGGRPAARLCHRLRLVAGRTRLLRLLTAPTVPDRAPRVLGVDEFAFRKGCTYGTVLVDVEAGRVVDVLPDRTKAWRSPGAPPARSIPAAYSP
ncbi:transposase [Streptomyces triticiradicis]|uniref:Transposase n=1 Tax=Streptomyces triticiradicis TaxID=2651189 RepID=A0A7J5D7B3_9ACTN|nr:transposase [Streptomyces triticiradicis]